MKPCIKKESNLQNLYNYVFDKTSNTYSFSTNHNISYRIVFIVDETFSTIANQDIPNVFQIIIEKLTNRLEPLDFKVAKTIEKIIESFFTKVENALIYVCSDDDNRAELRHNIFDRWYANSQYKDSVVKIDNIFVLKSENNKPQKLFTTFMFHKQNSNYHRLIEIYNMIERVLNTDEEK